MRRKILSILDREGYVSYTDLMDKLGLETTGQLNFHLKKLEDFINKDKKSYFLTESGKRVIKLMNLSKKILAGNEIEYLDNINSEMSRVGIIICKCNTEISNVLNIKALESYCKRINHVVAVNIFANLCQEKNLKKVANWCRDNYLNKVVIAACSPRTHQHIFERIFNGVIEKANIEIANIREQCCWVHQKEFKMMSDPVIVLKKAQILIEAAVERIILQKKVQLKMVKVEKSCAILGGGIAGMTLALDLARAGIKVYLIEKSPTLGGKVARWSKIYGMGDCSICHMSEIIGELVKEKNIKIFTNTEIESVSGEVGNFTIDLIKKPRYVDENKCTGCKRCTEICNVEKNNIFEIGLTNRKLIYIPYVHSFPYSAMIDEEDIDSCIKCRICERACINKAINLDQKPEKLRINVGTKVFAIGADLQSDLNTYKYNPKKNIITSAQFERILSSDGPTEGKIIKITDGKPPKSISIILGLGPLDYISEYSNTLALKYLDSIKTSLPDCEINVFFNLEKNKKINELMIAPKDSRFNYYESIEIFDEGSQNIVVADSKQFQSEMIVLNVDLVPNKDLQILRKTMDFTLDDYGFMSEETLASGVFGVGSVLGPLKYKSAISSAHDVAIKIISLLSNDYLSAEITGIEVDEEKCGLCGLCTLSCPYNAISIEKENISIDKFKCKGCGTCVSVCPTNAIEMNIDSTEKILRSIEVFSRFKSKPKIIAFCCRSCGYAAADEAGLKKIYYNPNIFIVKVPCSGRVDSNFIFKSFELGFDGVLIIGCRKNSCRYIDGVQRIGQKIKLLKEIIGPIAEKRIIHKSLNSIEGIKFAEIVNSFYQNLLEEVVNET